MGINENNEEMLKDDVCEDSCSIAEDENSAKGDLECITIKTSEYDGMKEKISELEDKLLRLAAEYDNYKKRAAKDKEALYSSSVCDVIEGMLPVMDNLERATSIISDSTEVDKVLEGINMVKNQFEECLSKLDVTAIPAVGEKFNPAVHNAVMHVEDENSGEQIVVEEFMKGYIKGDRVVRYSMVKVAN